MGSSELDLDDGILNRDGIEIFEEVAECISDKFGIYCKFRSKMLSPQTTYGTYLVYKLPHAYKDIKPPVQVVDENSDLEGEYNIFLSTPQTPVITGNAKTKRAYSPSIKPMIKGLPKMRSDGWMEVHVWEFQTRASIKMISTRLQFSSYDKGLKGLLCKGLSTDQYRFSSL
ncbi:putative F-box protein PP2-B8 [Bidens hawaiensis]|uniref:putative F-box protein PP2-B8 n=1 Tax=Bidens hawaiensis TaxID=980011 RepID=UPI004049FF85